MRLKGGNAATVPGLHPTAASKTAQTTTDHPATLSHNNTQTRTPSRLRRSSSLNQTNADITKPATCRSTSTMNHTKQHLQLPTDTHTYSYGSTSLLQLTSPSLQAQTHTKTTTAQIHQQPLSQHNTLSTVTTLQLSPETHTHPYSNHLPRNTSHTHFSYPPTVTMYLVIILDYLLPQPQPQEHILCHSHCSYTSATEPGLTF